MMDINFVSIEKVQNLINRIRAARYEECKRRECQCVTSEEHERSLDAYPPDKDKDPRS